MIEQLSKAGITSTMAYGASFASIFLSILVWNFRRSEDAAHAERFGIFVGLWAPTLAIFGLALQENERKFKVNI